MVFSWNRFLGCAFWVVAAVVGGSSEAAGQAAAPGQAPAPAPATRRWLDVQQLQISSRFRWIESTEGVVTSSSVQWQPQLRARFLVDRDAKYTVNVGAFGGSSFISGWNNTGAGLGEFGGAFYVKQLFVAAQPNERWRFEAGSLYLLRGENTEITSYDNDGFMEGERVSWSPARGPVTEVSITAGYLGDINDPNAFHRLDRMDQWNYGQALAAWRMSRRVTASADYTYENGRDILREGVTFRMPDTVKVVKALKVDAYQRLDPNADAGFDAAADFQPFRRLRITGGVESIDRAYGNLNADRYLVGTHAYTLGNYTLTRDLTAGWFHEEAIGHHRPLGNEHRFELFVTLNPTARLKQIGVF